MTEIAQGFDRVAAVRGDVLRDVRRNLIIGLIAFLTVVDLFATQAILPSLAKSYGVAPAAMGLAVNACTLGMAIAGLAVALFSNRINRRAGILASLCVLAVPDRPR
jgi:MFS transporter, YNFM family, putative membrane transport protein